MNKLVATIFVLSAAFSVVMFISGNITFEHSVVTLLSIAVCILAIIMSKGDK